MPQIELSNIAEIIIALSPLIAIGAKILDSRQEKRQRAAMKLNTLLLWGIRATGEISRQCALSIKHGYFTGAGEDAMAEYERFSRELDKFMNVRATREG